VRPPAGVPRVRDYWRMLVGSWLVILCATALSSAVAVAAGGLLKDPVYTASTQVFAVVPGDAQTHAAYEGNRGASVRVQTYAELATSSIVTLRTIDELGLQETPDELAEQISVRSVPDTLSRFNFPVSVLMGLTVSGSDPDTTVAIANAVTANLIAASEELEWHDSEAGPALVLIDEAKSASEVPRPWRKDAGTGAALGLVLSVLAVLAVGAGRDRILDRDQIGYLTDGSTVGARTEGTP
jgi:capsular polysaccharide biosynthesis protein